MSTMKDLAKIVADRNNMSRQDAEQFVAAFFDQLKIGLNTDELVKVKGLGTFKVQTMRSRLSVNVNTGERVVIDSHDRISFTPDKTMAESVNRPFSHFETVVLNEGVEFDDIDIENDSNIDTPEAKVEVPQPTVVVTPEPQPVIEAEPQPVVTPEPQSVVVSEPQVEPQPDLTPEPQPVVTEPLHVPVSVEPVEPKQEGQVVVNDRVVVNGPIVVNGPLMVNDSIIPAPKAEPAADEEPTLKAVTEEPAPKAESQPETPAEASVESFAVESHDALVAPTADEPQEETKEESESLITNIMQPQEEEQDNLQYDNPPEYDMRSSNLSESIWFTVLICLFVFIIGIVVGRATADITFDDIKNYITGKEKEPVKEDATIVYTGEQQHELYAVQDSIAADSMARLKEEQAKAETKAEIEARNLENQKAIENVKKQRAEQEAKKAEQDRKMAESKKLADASKAADAKKAVEAKVAQTPTVAIADKYKNDPRIRTGAYNIVGVQQVVTVRKGQTLSSIAKAYLGPGMECYVEAINGISSVEEGQKIKIPQLKHKKLKK